MPRAKAETPVKSLYDVHPGVAENQKWIATLKEKTGHSLEEWIKLAKKLGKDVKVCPCQTIVPFYRNHVFAQIKPSTKTRLDFGFALGDTKAKGRLIDTGGFAKKDRITHRIPITSLAEIDDEVARWLKTAYDLDA